MLTQIKKIVVVAGCQRSGTTLTAHMLGCHRQAFLIDEDDGLYNWVETCLFSGTNDEKLTNKVFAKADGKYKKNAKRIKVFGGQRKLAPEIDHLILKAPNLSYCFDKLKKLDIDVSIVFPIRDPRAVVASMEKLNHIDMVGNQIKRLKENPSVHKIFESDLKSLEKNQAHKHIQRAIIWRMKSGLAKNFEKVGLNPIVFKYEDLIVDKAAVSERITDHIGLPFDNKIIRHEKFFRGMAPGLTERTRPVDDSSMMKWKNRLGPRQEKEVLATAGKLARDYEYFAGANGHFVRKAPIFTRETFESPIILTGRGGSGTRLLSELAQKFDVFLGNRLNAAGDSMEWVDLIYEFAIKKNLKGVEKRKLDFASSGLLLDKTQDFLEAGNYKPDQLWGWKLPETMLLIPEMMSSFPKAKLVHLVRHPVTSSLRRTHMTSRLDNPIGRTVLRAAYRELGLDPASIKKDPEYLHNAVTWLFQVRQVHNYAMENLNAENYHLIRYEDLCKTPLETTKSLSRFMTGSVSDFIRPAVDPDRVPNIDFGDPAIAHIWSICGKVAMDMGYEPFSAERYLANFKSAS
ncbi:MAG: hypothetical protein HKN36_06145 [Hellea sp.]|nr:hypothetical protein [Hellea sp.]